MVEDKFLIWRFKRGSSDALRRIYSKYEGRLLTLAAALLIDIADAEDAVQDVFVKFAQSADKININGSLSSYLATCVVNRARDMMRRKARQKQVALDDVAEFAGNESDGPASKVIQDEESRRLHGLLARIAYEQREVLVLRFRENMTFRQIADLQGASINTVYGRYRYGLDKLRSLLVSSKRGAQ